MSEIEPATRKVKRTTKVGASAGAIVVNSTANRAYLVRSPNWLTVLDNETYAVTANIAVGKDSHSVALPLQPDLERTDRRFSKSVSLFPT